MKSFRQNPRHHRLFIEILCAPRRGPRTSLRRMNLYGVLGRYIPSFGARGRPHAIRSVPCVHRGRSHLVRGEQSAPAGDAEVQTTNFPALSQIMQSLPRQEIAYLAALFHDIAKGRGGRPLGIGRGRRGGVLPGGRDSAATRRAWSHGWSENHLILSITSQKKEHQRSRHHS